MDADHHLSVVSSSNMYVKLVDFAGVFKNKTRR